MTSIDQQPTEIADGTIVETVFQLLDARVRGATICPSEVARSLATEPAVWRALMPRVRHVAQQLAMAGKLRVTRRGDDVDATQPGGPVRLGLPGSADAE